MWKRKGNKNFWETILNVSQKFGVSCFLRLSLCNFVQILVGESTRYTDRSYVFQPFSFENLPHFNRVLVLLPVPMPVRGTFPLHVLVPFNRRPFSLKRNIFYLSRNEMFISAKIRTICSNLLFVKGTNSSQIDILGTTACSLS